MPQTKRPTKKSLKTNRNILLQRVREVCDPQFDVEAEVERIHPNFIWMDNTKAARRAEGISLLIRTAIYDALPDHWVQ